LLQDEYKGEPGAVIAADFYHSNALMPLSDEAIVALVQRNLEACEPGFIGAQALPHCCHRSCMQQQPHVLLWSFVPTACAGWAHCMVRK
jgi:hypothetical protein